MVLEFKHQVFRAAVFDMDGTMFDTERLRFSTLKQASQQLFGQEISDAVLYGSLGLSAKKAQALAQQHFGADYPYAAIRARADELELTYIRKYGVPVKLGLHEVLERLRKADMRLAVATSSRRAIAEEYLMSARVLRYFDVTVCGDEVTRGKPDPEIFQAAARQLGCAPQECLMVEDSENGLRAALAAGGAAVYVHDLKHPPAVLRKKAFAAYQGGMAELLDDVRACTPARPVPRVIDAFPMARSNAVVGIHGFGAIGGGYLAQVFSHWDGYVRPARIVGVTSNALYRGLVNHFGKYRVRYPHAAIDQTIDGITLIDAQDHDAVADLYAQAEIVGICLAESALATQAGVIAQGLYRRFEQGCAQPLVLPVLMNKVQAAAWVRELVADALQRRHGTAVAAQVLRQARFVETVVNRIVTKVPRETVLKTLRVSGRAFDVALGSRAIDPGPTFQQLLHGRALPAQQMLPMLFDKLATVAQLGDAAQQISLTLFHSSQDMALYVQAGEPLLERLCQMQTVEDIRMVQALKNRLLNGTHAILAWYAALLGHRTVAQGMADERVSTLVRRLANEEILPALAHGSSEFAKLADAFMSIFIKRCRNSFRDTCARVGRDPLRKLQRDERVIGTILQAHSLGIATPLLEYGVALALLYALRCAPESDKEAQRIRVLYARRNSVRDVLCQDGLYHGQPYACLDASADAELLQRITRHFNKLSAEGSSHWDWPLRKART
ncbi:HAD family hydrolase [Lampropedia cohaerens]|uniref:HAD family hydrolase n=1 Tax=Lampropedia cohaerens TaxID=1610491 RepID=A0A0U1PYB9_9BURK|nr:HAD family hydrolase [Lampropedia cohaerens]KKW67365.1 HAD family hydrolase [Lampropedia cohaerens]